MQSRIERIEGQIKRLVDAIIEGADAKPINNRLKEMEAERGRLIEEREKVPAERPLLHPNLAAVYRRHVEELGMALRDRENGHEAFELIRGLIQEVKLVPSDGELEIELKGELAGILAVADHPVGGRASSKEKAVGDSFL